MGFRHLLMAMASSALSLFVMSAAAQAALPVLLGSNLNLTLTFVDTNRLCLKACATSLATCFAEKPTTLTAAGLALDECRTAANSCITACNVPLKYTVSCEDRCATALQGCLIQAVKSQTDLKPVCQASNKSCLTKACRVAALQLATDYCPKQCTRGFGICAASNGIAGVDCPAVKNSCLAACPAQQALPTGTLSAIGARSTMQLRSDFSKVVTTLRGVNFNFKTFNLSLRRLSSQSCPESVAICEKTYKACLASIDQSDQAADQQLFEAKNECIQTCNDQPDPCFGLTKRMCAPMQTKACYCAGNFTGSQTCKQDGMAYDACACKPPQVCQSKSTAACNCETGVAGQKVCADDGQSYGACVCLQVNCTLGNTRQSSCTMLSGSYGTRVDTCNSSGSWTPGICFAAQ